RGACPLPPKATIRSSSSDPSLCAMSRHFRGTGVTEHPACEAVSLRPDVGIPHPLAPLLGVFDNELPKLAGRGCIGLQAQIDEPRLELRAGKRLIHELIKDGDDLRRRVRRRADSLPTARLVAPAIPQCVWLSSLPRLAADLT